MEKDSKKSSVWQSTIKVSKTFLINFKKFFANFNPNVLQIIQLTFIYFFAVMAYCINFLFHCIIPSLIV